MAAHHVVLRARPTPLGLMWRAVCCTSGCPWMGEPHIQPGFPRSDAELEAHGWDPEHAYTAARSDRSAHLDATGSPVDVVDRTPGVHWADPTPTAAERALDPAGLGDEVEAWLHSR